MINLKEKIEGLNSLLEFMDLDLSGLSEQQKIYWASIFYYLYEDKDAQIALDNAKPTDYLISIPRVSEVDLSVIQNALKVVIEKTPKRPGDPALILPLYKRHLSPGKDRYQILAYPPPKLSGANAPDLEALANTIGILIESLPLDPIKKCEECGKHFIHISKKVKKYCSPKCSYKHLSRKRREELKKHPRKYKAFKKSQREKMKRIYEQKKKVEFGPNVVVRRNAKRPNRKED